MDNILGVAIVMVRGAITSLGQATPVDEAHTG